MPTNPMLLWTGRSEAVNQSAQPLPCSVQVPFILHHKIVRRGRIPAHRFVVPKRHRLHHSPNDPPPKHPRWNPISYSPLHRQGAMRQHLRWIHLAPKPLAVWPKQCNPFQRRKSEQ